jgi:hypothetical protein
MNRFQRILSIAWLIAVTALAASAADLDATRHGPAVEVPEAPSTLLVAGQNCADPIVISSLPFFATGQTNCGLGNTYAATCLGNWDGGEDIIYRLDLAVGATIDIEMNPGATEWTALALATNCPPTSCLAINTGWTGVRAIRDRALAAGTYYIMVDTYPPPSCIPSFTLSVTADTPPPANDICDGAVDLAGLETNAFQVDLCTGYADDYDAGGTCTSGSITLGNDAAYKIHLLAGEEFRASMLSTGVYPILWLVTDCSNAEATCVAGGTQQNTLLSYVATGTGWYYLIVDSLNGCGLATVTIDAPVATETLPWGGLKARFK